MSLATLPNPTWYVREHLRGAFPPYVPPSKRIVASLYTVYLDESGTHTESKFAVVAGFVSNVTQWNALTERWQEVLEKNDPPVDFFHMVDFESRQGQFKGWGEDDKRKLLNKLLPLINDHTFWSVGCVVMKEWVDSLLSEPVRQIVGDAYGLGALACWRHLGEIFKKRDAWMTCTMEFGAKGAGALQLLAEEDSKFPEWQDSHRLFSLSFQNKRAFPPLQVADILAYELYKQSLRLFGDEERNIRYPLKQFGKQKHQWHYLDKKHLVELNQDMTKQLVEWHQRNAQD